MSETKTSAPLLPAGCVEIKLAFVACCAACNEIIPAGAKGVHVPRVGMHHPACVPKVSVG